MEEVLKHIAELVEKYKYRPLPIGLSVISRQLYRDNIPEFLSIDGSTDGLITKSGKKITYYGYDRIVIGDYGAYIEFDADRNDFYAPDAQKWRLDDTKYSNIKYIHLCPIGDESVKIYYQLNPVKYAEYKPYKYYVSVFDVEVVP
jgi:hypothetical protein